MQTRPPVLNMSKLSSSHSQVCLDMSCIFRPTLADSKVLGPDPTLAKWVLSTLAS